MKNTFDSEDRIMDNSGMNAGSSKAMNAMAISALILGALAFPFSVALTNIALGVVLGMSLLSGQWLRGCLLLWKRHRLFLGVLSLYLSWVLLGLLWSSNPRNGLAVLGHHWFWLLLPALAALLRERRTCNRVLMALSFGLTLHLGYCVLQALGMVHVSTDGSSMRNATGHIGHIGFGFVYAVWGAWMLHLGLHLKRKPWRWACLFLALWSAVEVFMAQGRAGYVLMLMLMLVVLGRWGAQRFGMARMLGMLGGMSLMVTLALGLGPAHERITGTWLAWQHQAEHAKTKSAKFAANSLQQRVKVLRAAWELWREHPWLGVGTGSFLSQARPVYARMFRERLQLAHPHNQYLLVLARWGVGGFASLLLLYAVWLWQGWRMDWSAYRTAPLMFLAGLALVVDGLCSISMEQHFSAVLAVLLLGAAFASASARSMTGIADTCS